MANIECVKRDKGVVTHIGVVNVGFGPEELVFLNPEDANQAMERGTRFFIEDTEVIAVLDGETQRFKFLRSLPDGTTDNNLDNIDPC
ncbi:MAG: DUF3892 domain-containing protein [Anaerolineae bacterium]|nr:DUF3892 domain-containing protein [Anaerolineae bacterium]